MNAFTERDYSQLKNSCIATYLSFCDFYRPKFFILVTNIIISLSFQIAVFVPQLELSTGEPIRISNLHLKMRVVTLVTKFILLIFYHD